jgi:hypothetical protein
MKLRDKYLVEGPINEYADTNLYIQGSDADDFQAAISALISNTRGASLTKGNELDKLRTQIRHESVLIVPRGIVAQLIKALEDAVLDFDPKQSGQMSPKQHEEYKKKRVAWANKLIKILKKG